MPEWEDVPVPAGSFVGWGSKKGQHVTGRVIEYAIDGATDFNGGKCPLLAVELTEPAASFNKEGERTDYPEGDMVQITCGQVKLKAGIRNADPSPGDLIKVELIAVSKTTAGHTLKEFAIKIARGAAVGTSKPAAAAAAEDDNEPPF